jgi:hypothetical protein
MDRMHQAVMVPVHADVLVLRHDTPVLEPMADFSRLPHATPAGDANADVAYVSEEILSCPFEDNGHMLRAGVHLHWSLPDALTRGVSHGVLFGKELYDWHAKELDNGIVPEDVRALFASHGLPLSAGASAVRIPRRSQRWQIYDPQNERGYTARAGTHWELDATGVRPTPRLNIHAGKVQFPPVPNRWLVSRTGIRGLPVKKWVVESDYLHAPEGPPTDAISYPHSDAQRPEPFRRLGRQWTLDDWMEKRPEDVEYLDRLTAVGYGEPTFAAFHPNCHCVFGFHDDELAGDLAACGMLTYDVIGWFSDLANDCVCSTDFMEALDATVARYSLQHMHGKNDAKALKAFDALRFETLDRRYGWKVEPDGDTPFPRRTLCYARVKIDGAGFRFDDDTRQEDARRKVTVAVANTGTEALSAYLAECLPHGGGERKSKLEEQLEALQLAPRLQGRQLDLGAKFREARHEQGFSGVSGGSGWTVAPAYDASNSSESPVAPPPLLPAAIAPLLDRLNAEQARCDRIDHELESMQTQLYADWCKYMLCAYPPGDAIDVFPVDMDEARDFVERRLLGPLADKSDEARAAHAECARTHNQVATALAAFRPQGSAPLKLKRLPAPRFWKPTDPVVLIAGEATGAAMSHMQAVTRPCGLMPYVGKVIELHFDELLAAVAKHAIDERSGLHQCAQQSWHPFLLEWRVGLHAAGPDGYVPAPSSFVGRSLVNAYAGHHLRERLETVLVDSDSRDPVTESLSAVLDELRREERPEYWCLTQALSGFNDALLMHKRTLQLPVEDPLGFEDARAFAARVRKAVGRRNRTAPQPSDDFQPIRTGALELIELRLVDIFGRVQDLRFDHRPVITPDAMTVPGRDHLVALPPRLVQPARLNFRWLPGAGDDGASSVVCGWIVHNRFDRSLAVHAASGAPLGAIALDEARWRPAPGSLFPSTVDEIDDAHLRSLVAWLVRADRDAMATQIEGSLEWIEPEDFAPHPIAAFLVGRPLAVVRATLGLELRGLPAVDQGWPAFEHAMAADDAFTRDSDGFTRVPFAVRLGDPGQLNDGLVALWLETPADGAGVTLHELPHVRGSEPQLRLAIADPAVQLTMLVDPRCVVHAAADILPAKSIGLPQDQVLHALSRLQSSLRIGPVLMPEAHVRLPLPAETGFEWTWVERSEGVWRTAGAIERPLAGASWEAPQALRDGWIRRTPANRTEVSG